MRFLVLFHRWLGVALCLPVAMWFATGIVMHLVPFPAALGEAERLAGTDEIDLVRVQHGPGEAVAASAVAVPTRVRLIERGDGPVYLVLSPSGTKAIRAADLADATIRSNRAALSIALDYARGRADFAQAGVVSVVSYDQWTLSAGYDPHRPLYRIALDDAPASELYLSSTSGEVVLATTGAERAWNYAGSILHWIYFTGLRSHPAVWSAFMWWLSLLALAGAVLGAFIGPWRLKVEGRRLVSPFRGWQAWHHGLGLVCAPFILTWTFSGWLSLDDGSLFASGRPTAAEMAALLGEPAWDALTMDEIRRTRTPAREITWSVFAGRIYRGERETNRRQRLVPAGLEGESANLEQETLHLEEIDAAFRRVAARCQPAFPVRADDGYASAARMRGRPVVRVVCGEDWFHVAADDGALFEKLDPSRRRYRWLYQGLHKLDFPVFTEHPTLRTILIVILCACGVIFSITAVVIAARRVSSLSHPSSAMGNEER